jgi:predicted flavoprotein YhiN
MPRVLDELQRPRGPRSLATHLKSRLGIAGLKLALLHEVLGADGLADTERLGAALKALPLQLSAPRPMDEAISTAGGVPFAAMDAHLMLRAVPGVFCAGEMLDWEAPTGGYLLTACWATGRWAGLGALRSLG